MEAEARTCEVEPVTGLCRGFVSIRGYRNKEGELSDYVLNGGVSYHAAVERSLVAIEDLTPERVAAECPPCAGDLGLAALALNEVRASWERTLAGTSNAPDVYDAVEPGLKEHREQGGLYVCGLLVSKRVREAGEYKPVKSSAKTLVKRWITERAPVDRYRQFGPLNVGEPGKWESITASGLTIYSADGRREREVA